MKRFSSLMLVVGLSLLGTVARADIQKDGPEAWPGKVMIGVAPLGVQASFNNGFYNGTAASGYATYKVGINVAGIIADLPKVTLWLGGEFNIGGGPNLAQIEPGIFVGITLEKLLRIPLVPIITAGFSGPIDVPYGYNGNVVAGAFEFKFGGGAYYFLTRNIGLGAETHFAFGPGFISVNGIRDTSFAGYFDFLAGAKFAL